MKISTITAVFSGLMVAGVAWAQTQPAAPATVQPEAKAATPVPSRVTMASVLNKRIENIEWDELPLESVMEWVQEQGPINVVVRWRALEIEGITQDTPISLRLRNAAVGQILTEALDTISGTDSGVRYRGIGNTLQVSTRTDFNSKLYTKAYDATDLLFKVKSFTDGPTINLAEQSQGGGGGGGNFGQSTGQIFEEGEGGEEDDEDSDEEDRERLQELVDLIINTIEPDTWRDNGGKGTIVGYKRTIVIHNNIEVHEKIGGPFSTE